MVGGLILAGIDWQGVEGDEHPTYAPTPFPLSPPVKYVNVRSTRLDTI